MSKWVKMMSRRLGSKVGSSGSKLRLLVAVGEASSTENPYIALLYRGLSDVAEVEYFTWWRALFGRFDVMHVHWPEALVSGRLGWRRSTKFVLTKLLFWRIRATRKALVRTIHNEVPHEEPNSVVRKVVEDCDRTTTGWIRLNDQTRYAACAESSVIPHGHYRDWYEEIPPLSALSRPSALFFGLVRRYKGLEDVLDAFRDETTLSYADLRIAGRPDDMELAAEVSEMSRRFTNVVSDLRYVPDGELVDYIRGASLVILPYRSVGNSGAALLALSMNRPILMPRHLLTEELRSEFGREYVHLFDSPLKSSDVDNALSSIVASAPYDRAPMQGRDWRLICGMHHAVYTRAREIAKQRGRDKVLATEAVEHV